MKPHYKVYMKNAITIELAHLFINRMDFRCKFQAKEWDRPYRNSVFRGRWSTVFSLIMWTSYKNCQILTSWNIKFTRLLRLLLLCSAMSSHDFWSVSKIIFRSGLEKNGGELCQSITRSAYFSKVLNVFSQNRLHSLLNNHLHSWRRNICYFKIHSTIIWKHYIGNRSTIISFQQRNANHWI